MVIRYCKEGRETGVGNWRSEKMWGKQSLLTSRFKRGMRGSRGQWTNLRLLLYSAFFGREKRGLAETSLLRGILYQKRLRGRSERQWVKSAEIARIKTTRRVVVVFF